MEMLRMAVYKPAQVQQGIVAIQGAVTSLSLIWLVIPDHAVLCALGSWESVLHSWSQ